LHRFRNYELSDRVRGLLKNFKRAEYQVFGNGLESNRFLSEYCSYCQKLKKCRINYELRNAMDKNKSYWANSFIRFERNLNVEVPEGAPTTRIHCKEYQEAQRKV
jgi:hypothetical protein